MSTDNAGDNGLRACEHDMHWKGDACLAEHPAPLPEGLRADLARRTASELRAGTPDSINDAASMSGHP